ncbi:MAG: hypothetical protein RBR74_03170 [Ignavibacteriaceae bacterium]|jgi:predicted membrane channel-forming protein YqfA (hemolysin III family)|nr:hypothetical protein [Ignavibacteriaceae bacterium]
MKKKWYTYFNYSTIILAIAAAVLLFLNLLPRNWYVPVLVIMIVIFILRIAARVYFIKAARKSD